jgi:hypothetical protein
MRVTLWICPSFGCGNYFGSSSAGDLDAEFNTTARGEPTFPRSRCPICATKGRDVKRLQVTFEDGMDLMRNADLDQRMALQDESS